MDLNGILPVSTERLLLRRLEPDDAAALLALYGDEIVMRYWCHSHWTCAAQADQAITEARAELLTGHSMHLAITSRADRQVIGSCALYALAPEHARATLGFLLARPYWGKGYAAEAVSALLASGFNWLGLNRIEAEVAIENDASARMLARLGFRYEGRMRARWMVAGKPRSIAGYALLREEWESLGR